MKQKTSTLLITLLLIALILAACSGQQATEAVAVGVVTAYCVDAWWLTTCHVLPDV